jgi:hypothetical protein
MSATADPRATSSIAAHWIKNNILAVSVVSLLLGLRRRPAPPARMRTWPPPR